MYRKRWAGLVVDRHSPFLALTFFCRSRSAWSALRCSHSMVPRNSERTRPPLTKTAWVQWVQGRQHIGAWPEACTCPLAQP